MEEGLAARKDSKEFFGGKDGNRSLLLQLQIIRPKGNLKSKSKGQIRGIFGVRG